MFRSCVKKLQKSLSLFVHSNQDQLEAATLVPEDVMEGHFAVLAIKGEETRRFVVRLDYLTDPMFMELLNQAREEYGFKQKGTLAVPCRPQELQNILDDGTRAKKGRVICGWERNVSPSKCIKAPQQKQFSSWDYVLYKDQTSY